MEPLQRQTTPKPEALKAREHERSRKDFIHKLKIVVKELHETRIWLKIIVRGELMAAERIHTDSRRSKRK